MPREQKRQGMLTWTNLNSPDVGAAKAFYSGLFGWVSDEVPAGPDASYVMFKKGGKTVAGLGQQPSEMSGMPAVWP